MYTVHDINLLISDSLLGIPGEMPYRLQEWTGKFQSLRVFALTADEEDLDIVYQYCSDEINRVRGLDEVNTQDVGCRMFWR